MNELDTAENWNVTDKYSARLGMSGSEMVDEHAVPLDIWDIAAVARLSGSAEVPEMDAAGSTERAPQTTELVLTNLMEEAQIGATVRAGMGRMAVAVALWPGIDRRTLHAAATVGGVSENFAHTGKTYLLDLATTARHVCAGQPEAGPRALIQRICVPNMAAQRALRHAFAFVPSGQLSELAAQPHGAVPWLDVALAELAAVRFAPPDLAEIVERQRKIEILRAQQLHHRL